MDTAIAMHSVFRIFRIYYWIIIYKNNRSVFYNDHIGLCTDDLFFLCELEALGGDDGMNISRSYFHLIDINEDINLYYLICIIFIISLFSIIKIIRSRFGITIQAIKSNEDRAKSLGVNVFKFKISAFVIASIICGLAGFLYANLNEYIAPNIMHWSRSGGINYNSYNWRHWNIIWAHIWNSCLCFTRRIFTSIIG